MRLQKASLHKRLLVGLLAPVLCVLLFLSTISITNMIKINHFAFDRGAGIILERAEELTRKAVNFDQAAVLSELGPNPMNGFYYRFDENLEKAHHVGQPCGKPGNAMDDQSICFEFDDKDNFMIRPSVEDFAGEDGLLKYEFNGSNILESFGELAIDEDSIGEIEIKLKLRNSRRVSLAWRRSGSLSLI